MAARFEAIGHGVGELCWLVGQRLFAVFELNYRIRTTYFELTPTRQDIFPKELILCPH